MSEELLGTLTISCDISKPGTNRARPVILAREPAVTLGQARGCAIEFSIKNQHITRSSIKFEWTVAERIFI